MKTMSFIEFLKENRACDKAIEWCFDNAIFTMEQAWHYCPKLSWMFWLLRILDEKHGTNFHAAVTENARIERNFIYGTIRINALRAFFADNKEFQRIIQQYQTCLTKNQIKR